MPKEIIAYITSSGIGKALGYAFGAALGGITSWWMGGGPFFQYVLLAAGVLFVADWLLGILVSRLIYKEPISSPKANKALAKMSFYGFGLLLLHICDGFASAATGASVAVYTAQIAWLSFVIYREGISVLENMKELEAITGIQIPEWVARKIDDLQKNPTETKAERKARHHSPTEPDEKTSEDKPAE